MKRTVAKKLVALASMGIALVVGAGVAGYAGLSAVHASMDDVAGDVDAVRDGGMIDMMHDALRGDARMAIVAAESGSAEELQQVLAEIGEHVAFLRSQLTAAARDFNDEKLREELGRVAPVLEGYGQLATEIGSLAMRDRAAAVARLPELDRVFKSLETQLAKLLEDVDASSNASRAHGASAVLTANRIIVADTILSVIALLGFALWITVGITRRLNAAVG